MSSAATQTLFILPLAKVLRDKDEQGNEGPCRLLSRVHTIVASDTEGTQALPSVMTAPQSRAEQLVVTQLNKICKELSQKRMESVTGLWSDVQERWKQCQQELETQLPDIPRRWCSRDMFQEVLYRSSCSQKKEEAYNSSLYKGYQDVQTDFSVPNMYTMVVFPTYHWVGALPRRGSATREPYFSINSWYRWSDNGSWQRTDLSGKGQPGEEERSEELQGAVIDVVEHMMKEASGKYSTLEEQLKAFRTAWERQKSTLLEQPALKGGALVILGQRDITQFRKFMNHVTKDTPHWRGLYEDTKTHYLH